LINYFKSYSSFGDDRFFCVTLSQQGGIKKYRLVRDRHTVVTTRDNKQKITNQFHWVIENKIKTITWT